MLSEKPEINRVFPNCWKCGKIFAQCCCAASRNEREALDDYLHIRDEMAELEMREVDCQCGNFSTCDLCRELSDKTHQLHGLLEQWGDSWATRLASVAVESQGTPSARPAILNEWLNVDEHFEHPAWRKEIIEYILKLERFLPAGGMMTAEEFFGQWEALPQTQSRWGQNESMKRHRIDILADADCTLVHEFADALSAHNTAALARELHSSQKLAEHFSKLAGERWDRVTELELKVACLQGSHRAAEDALAKNGELRAEIERLKGELAAVQKELDQSFNFAKQNIEWANTSAKWMERARVAEAELARLRGQGAPVCGKKFTGHSGRTIFTCALPAGHFGDHDDHPTRAAVPQPPATQNVFAEQAGHFTTTTGPMIKPQSAVPPAKLQMGGDKTDAWEEIQDAKRQVPQPPAKEKP